MFEFAQGAVRAMGPIEHESLAALADLGFRFSMDHVTDLRIEPRELAERGFRFIKVPAALLLDEAGAAGRDIHPADFSDLLGRFGIDLIAERIESERQVVDLLDYDVRFGQGFLFSPPRPVRAEVLQVGASASREVIRADRPAERRHDAARRLAPAGGSAAHALCIASCRSASSGLTRRSDRHLRSRRTTTSCSATSGAWCTTASPRPRRPARRSRAFAKGRHRDADHQRAAAGRGGDALPRQLKRAARGL